MPPHTRSQRRRQAATQQKSRPAAPSTGAASRVSTTGPTVPLESAAPANARPAGQRAARRVSTRVAPAPVDYGADYTAVRRDLRWILLWTVLLFVAMIALKFSGLV